MEIVIQLMDVVDDLLAEVRHRLRWFP